MSLNATLQLAIALACVAAALAFLGVRGWRWWRGRSAGCGSCPAKNSGKVDSPIVPLNIPPALRDNHGSPKKSF